MRLVREISIAAPRGDVWRLIADDDGRKLWMPDLVAVTYPAGRPKGDPTGTRFRKTLREGSSIRSFAGEIAAYVEGRLRSIRLADDAITMEIDYRLGTDGDATRVRYVGQFRMAGGGAAMLGPARPLIERRVGERLASLKAAAERPRGGGM